MSVRAYAAPDLAEAILLHVVKNHLPQFSPPLILAVQGPKGEGKSFQVREVLSRMGSFAVPISGAHLSGSTERAPVEIMEKTYFFASVLRHTRRRMTCIIIDDFDLSVASTKTNREYTVNSQLLTGFLMNLCDNPTICGDRSTQRTPIIVTGNDFSNLHAPLIRHGRANVFSWIPTLEYKAKVFEFIFDKYLTGWSQTDIFSFVAEFEDEATAFFSMLKDDYLTIILNEQIRKVGLNIEALQNHIATANKRPADFKTLQSLGQKRRASSQIKNFNSKDRWP